jgi:hypothetical protein
VENTLLLPPVLKISKDSIIPVILRFPYHCSIFEEINRLSYNQNTRQQNEKMMAFSG